MVTTPNLSRKQQEALLKLKSYNHLTIKEADKGGQVVVMNNAHYKNMCKALSDKNNWYQPISFTDLDAIFLKFYTPIGQAQDDGIINNKIWKFIKKIPPKNINILEPSKAT